MTQQSSGESSEAILTKARVAGFEVSENQLKRWQREGLIPRPTQNWLKGMPGSQAIYPLGSGDQLCALCRVQTEGRSSRDWGWKLWWLGFPVDRSFWWQKLRAQALVVDKSSKTLVSRLGSGQADDGYDDAINTLSTQRTRNKIFRRLRRRAVDDHFEGAIGLIVSILENNFLGWSFKEPDDADSLRYRRMIERTFGFHRAKNDREMIKNPSMHADVENALQLLSDQLGETTFTNILRNCSDHQINETRTQLRIILFMTTGANEKSNSLAEIGITVLKELALEMKPADQATFLLYLLALKRNSTFHKNLAVFLHALRRHVPKTISDAQIEEFRKRDPAVCSFAFPI